MKFRILSAVFILFFLTACNGRSETGLEQSSTTTDSPAITPAMTLFPNSTLTPIDILLSPAARTATGTSAPETSPIPNMVQIFLIAVDDNGQAGFPVGCGDSAIPVQVEIPPTQEVLKAVLVELLSNKDQYYGQSGLYNALYQSDLQVESVSIQDGKASVYLTGSLMMGGVCDTPRVQAQLEYTVLQFPSVTEANIFINGQSLAEALSLEGQ